MSKLLGTGPEILRTMLGSNKLRCIRNSVRFTGNRARNIVTDTKNTRNKVRENTNNVRITRNISNNARNKVRNTRKNIKITRNGTRILAVIPGILTIRPGILPIVLGVLGKKKPGMLGITPGIFGIRKYISELISGLPRIGPGMVGKMEIL